MPVRFLKPLLLLPVFILVHCSTPPPSRDSADSGYLLSYQMSPDTCWQFETRRNGTTRMEMMDQKMDIATRGTYHYDMTLARRDKAGRLHTQIAINRMEQTLVTPQGEMDVDLSSLNGKTFGYVMTESGREIAYTGADTIFANTGGMAGGRQSVKMFFQYILPRLPEKPVKVGQEWTHSDKKTMNQQGADVQVKSETLNILEAVETVNGHECLRIVSNMKGTLYGEGQRAGRRFTFQGEVENIMTWHFAYKQGALVKLDADDFLEATVTMDGQQHDPMPISTAEHRTITWVE